MSTLPQIEPRLVYRINDLCELLSCVRATVHRLIASGKLKAYKEGRRTLIRHEDLQAYLDSLPRYDITAQVAGNNPGTRNTDRKASV